MNENEIVAVVSIIVTIISIIVSVHFGISNAKIKKAARTIQFSDLPHIADFVHKECKKIDFMPNIIFTPDVENYQLAKSISSKFNNILILNGLLIKKERKEENVPEILRKEYYTIDTVTWHTLVPKALFENLFENEPNKILFVEDLAVTGGLIKHIKDYLRNEKKFELETNFKSFCIATTKLAQELDSGPDFYWKEISTDDNLYLPWGKVRR
jgi:hypothetical protein